MLSVETREKFDLYITKYALTKGIIKTEGETTHGSCGSIVRVDRKDMYYIDKPYWHLKEEDAIEHAENMRDKKIESLTKQIEKLKNLKFKKD